MRRAPGLCAASSPPSSPGIARTRAGATLAFDALLVAVGAWSEPAVAGATTWTPELDQEVMGGLLADIEEGYAKRVAFVVPDGAGWPLPAYELALMTAWDARDMGQDDVEVAVVHARVRAAGDVRRGGIGVAAARPRGGGRDAAPAAGVGPVRPARDRAAARRRAARSPGSPPTSTASCPSTRHGRVAGLDDVWAAGDCTAFPIKQGGLAAQQADAAAASIAAHAGAGVVPSAVLAPSCAACC